MVYIVKQFVNRKIYIKQFTEFSQKHLIAGARILVYSISHYTQVFFMQFAGCVMDNFWRKVLKKIYLSNLLKNVIM